MKNVHLTDEERQMIFYLWHVEGIQNCLEIGRRLGRSDTTIGREIKRNKTMIEVKDNNNPKAKKDPEKFVYLPEKAKVKYLTRRKESKQKCPLKNLDLYEYVIEKLKEGMSPLLISGRAKREGIGDISHECIYQFIYSPEGQRLELWKYLIRSHKKRRKCSGRKGKQTLIPNRISIRERPKIIEERKEMGHWEGDSIVGVGKGSALHTQVERTSRYVQIRKIKRKNAHYTKEAMIDIFKSIPSHLRLSSTEDNGCEFVGWEDVASTVNIDIYFARRYRSCDRGTNERANGLVRRFFPKRTNFDDITDDQIQKVQDWINNRPMACLNFRTPNEVFHNLL